MRKSPIVVCAAALGVVLACGGAQHGEPAGSAAPVARIAPTEPTAVAPAESAAPTSRAPLGTAGAAPASAAEVPSGASSAPAAAPVEGATANASAVDIGEVKATGGTLPNQNEAVAALRSGLGGCVARVRAQHSDAEGQVTLTIRVGLAGQVLGVAAQQTTKIPATLVSCMATRAATAEFEPPRGAKAQVSVVIPVTVSKP
jgi:hypothetical protein